MSYQVTQNVLNPEEIPEWIILLVVVEVREISSIKCVTWPSLVQCFSSASIWYLKCFYKAKPSVLPLQWGWCKAAGTIHSLKGKGSL